MIYIKMIILAKNNDKVSIKYSITHNRIKIGCISNCRKREYFFLYFLYFK
jgi:hypothetical protein